MILVEENENILKYVSYINEYKFKISKKSNLSKLKKEYDITLFFINEEKDINILKEISGKIIIFLKNIETNLLWEINNNCECIDVININNDVESILERIRSNLKKGEHANEKN